MTQSRGRNQGGDGTWHGSFLPESDSLTYPDMAAPRAAAVVQPLCGTSFPCHHGC
ncbi:hypothetical protein D554_2835 [Bordetella holmesii 30539]|uniref:N-acetyltransferase YedL n=1 Tax=Bordetella holmesii 1058 TaxID=1247648 RepID=A0ABN0RWB6_9BORD|nr:hypothetical protein D558_2887 [Bordetella holmesii 44057]EWM42023.1 hypothetical protein D556_2882 [Bordetella holmesii 41130]EWM48135.1 hypothetical protein D555_2931 [Bordetella holmesii 35009]EWM49115.1 hypothetical protein D557_2183 [Bordetella holmesii 70147]EXF87575.1 hypothetical protein D554_2835 [Bordetella holmesii 30539]EXX93576.1 hypothetical protein D559_0968 [Bordetella holmesii 1058]